jgi:methionyl-tRNA formyltransferase
MKIVFMGTPDFAVASLKALLNAGENVVAVITAPDKPAGRGQKMQSSAVKTFAEAHNIPVLQPLKLRDPKFLNELKSFAADLQVVVAFRMLPEVVWDMPPKGTINLHASLLPQYRGAAPINHAIVNGETVTGVSTFFLTHDIDTGNIIFREEVDILPQDTAGDLHDRLMKTGAQLLVKTVKAIEEGNYQETPQNLEDTSLKQAPKIFKEDCNIDWNQSTQKINDLIRGLSPYPTAYTTLHDKVLKIFKATPEIAEVSEIPGSIISDEKTFIKFACTDGYIRIEDLQIQGKKRMKTEDFLRGYRFP